MRQFAYQGHDLQRAAAAMRRDTPIAMDEWRGVLAVLIVLASFLYKLRKEERFMVETFGEVYRDYRRRIRALIPFVL